MQSRRDTLRQIATVFAMAAVPCAIPEVAIAELPVATHHQRIFRVTADDPVQRYNQLLREIQAFSIEQAMLGGFNFTFSYAVSVDRYTAEATVTWSCLSPW